MSLGYVIVDVSTDTPLRRTSWRSACRSSPTRRHQTLARYISKIVLSVFRYLLPASQRGERGSMSSIAARPRQGLLWLVQAIVRSGATFPRRTGRYDQGWRRRRPQVQRAVLGGPLRPGPRGRSHCGVDGTRTTDLPDTCYKAGHVL